VITKRQYKRLTEVQGCVQAEMNMHAGDKYSRGMSSEGYAGGYLQAMRDLELFLGAGVEPNTRMYWMKPPPDTEEHKR